MRKQTKLVAVLSTAALLAIGASMTSFAATGWQEEDGTWVYYNRDGDKATEEWKKSGDNWFWLDDNGEMAIDTLVEDDDDYYYVDANGAMVTNQWVAIDNEDAGEEDEPDHYWYYFQSNGKAYKRSDSASDSSINAKTINGKKYAFDTDGRMLYGWVSGGERQTDDDAWQESLYYFGDEDDGAMSLGWRQISITDDNADSLQPGDEFWDEDQDRWFYFQSSGKKVVASDNDTLKTKTINGKKYGFDEYGRMIADWFTEATPVTAGSEYGTATYSSSFMYFSTPEDGARYTKGWFKVVPGYYLQNSNYNDESEKWFYADGDGNIYANEIKSIKGKKYAFDNYGRMISGLVFLEMDTKDNGAVDSNKIASKFDDDADVDGYDTEDEFDAFVENYAEEISEGKIRSYYFGDSSDGSMKTGKQTVSIDGDSFTFKFVDSSSKKGAGFQGIDDHKLYLAGKLVKADSDDKYKVVVYTENEDGVIKMEKLDTDEFIDQYTDGGVYDEKKEETVYTVDKDKAAGAKLYLVNTSGSMMKNKTNSKDGEDYKFTTSNYEITKVTLED